jgi:hypothetical protein
MPFDMQKSIMCYGNVLPATLTVSLFYPNLDDFPAARTTAFLMYILDVPPYKTHYTICFDKVFLRYLQLVL